MAKLAFPPELTVAKWEQAAGEHAKTRPTVVADALRELARAADAIDFDAFDTSEIDDLEQLPAARKKADEAYDRHVFATRKAANAVVDAARKWGDALDSKNKKLAPVVAAASAVKRAAKDYGIALDRVALSIKLDFDDRERELKVGPRAGGKPSPELLKLKPRIVDEFRKVKMRPDQKVVYLLCVGNRSAAPYLGRTATDSNKPLLTRALKGDGNFKYYKGEVKWEEGAYTFIGRGMTATLARRIATGVAAITGTTFRIRAHD